MKKIFFLFSLCLATLFSDAQTHFITERAYRQRVETDFKHKISVVGETFFDLHDLHPDLKETEALKFLYAYMPLGDVTDYSTSYYLENVRTSFKAQDEMPWGKIVPELLFRHFVLPIRVNNENLDNARIVFYPELKERVKGLDMKEAILEVNHWCHEKVTYQPSDSRTSSPLASVCNAYGRCGEESTFTVAALRSIGIPARQVYTPRWAHTDDNHAWVEAWANGKWYFLGACEPEPVLNLGWFNAPASRALLMHTRVFGHYDGPEEVMLETPNFTEINLIGNYASTARIDFKVIDSMGKPVSNARVDFKIYNYAEFCTVATKYTNKDGMTFLTSGKGDMIIWVSKNGEYNFTKVSFGKDKKVTIRLSSDVVAHKSIIISDSFDIVPPKEQAILPVVSNEMRKLNDIRKVMEDSIRNVYMSTFLNTETATAITQSLSLPSGDVVPLLVASRGNHEVISAFLKKYAKADPARAVTLLKDISVKDLRDITMDVLDDSYRVVNSWLDPRVANEMLRPYKLFFLQSIPRKSQDLYRHSPELLVQWCKKNIRIHDEMNSLHIPMSAVGVWKSRVADVLSRDIFFVDVARSLGIEARKDPVTLKTQYRINSLKWMDVDFNSIKSVNTPTGKLFLTYQSVSSLQNPKYYSHFTISKIQNGITSLLNFDEGKVDMGDGVSWVNTFKKGINLDEGTYLLVSGTRLADGSVLSSSQIFNIKRGTTTIVELKLRNKPSAISVIGTFDSESKFESIENSDEKSILSRTGRGYFVIGLLGVGQEPTNHALNDLIKMKENLEKWGRPILLLFASEEDRKRFRIDEFGLLPSTVFFGIDKTGEIKNQIIKKMHLSDVTLLPIFIVADTFNRVVFLSQGYTIGLGEQLYNVVSKIGK